MRHPYSSQGRSAASIWIYLSVCGLFCVIIPIALSGCAHGPLRDARNAFYAEQQQDAVNILSDSQKISKKDRLLLFMEKGLMLHELGQYKDSIIQLRNAADLVKKQEVISVSQQAGSLVTNEWVTEYKGEYSERLLVHTYLMMNFLLIGDYEGALVEGRQALHVIEKYPDPLNQDLFTRALIALCYESLGEINDAYIEYKKLAERINDSSTVAPKLYLSAKALGFNDDAKKYRENISGHIRSAIESGYAELILFVAAGKSPVKVPGTILLPNATRFSFPRYKSRASLSSHVRINKVSDMPLLIAVNTNVDRLSKAALNKRAASVIAKETIRLASKKAVRDKIDDPLVEFITTVIFFIMEEADTRGWETLPGRLSLISVPIAPGKQTIDVSVLNSIGGTLQTVTLPEINAVAGKKYFHSIRVFD